MFWGIEHETPAPGALPRVRITLGSHHRTFTLSIPWAELRTSDGQQLVEAWATTIIAIPDSGIGTHEVERLLDFIREHYSATPRHKTTRKPRLGLFGF